MLGIIIQIIALVVFVMGYGMFIGGGLTYGLTNGKSEIDDNFYDVSFGFGSAGIVFFIIGVVINHGLFFL